jgi:hypothetical protein
MDLSKLSPAMIAQMASMVEDYINSSRKKYAPQAVPLTEAQRSAMQPFFPPEVLDRARLCVLQGQRVPNPSIVFHGQIDGIPQFAGLL